MGHQTGGEPIPTIPSTGLSRWLYVHVPSVRRMVQGAWMEGLHTARAEERGDYWGEPMPSYVTWSDRRTTVETWLFVALCVGVAVGIVTGATWLLSALDIIGQGDG